MMITRTFAIATALCLMATPSFAQSACETTTSTDFLNMTYVPSRSSVGRNGYMGVGPLGSALGGDQGDTDKISKVFYPRMSDEAGTARATVNVLNAWVEAATFVFGYASAGVDLILEARDSNGALLCTQTQVVRNEYYIGAGHATPGNRSLSCALPAWTAGTEDFISVSVTLEAWYTVAGTAYARAEGSAQLVSLGLEGCSGSCASSCGGVASSGTCYCDDSCTAYGDCCADFAPVCDRASCWERCDDGIAPAGTCFCDEVCTGYGDCCSDYADSCI